MSIHSKGVDHAPVRRSAWRRSLSIAALTLAVGFGASVQAQAEPSGDVVIALPSMVQKFDGTAMVGATPHMNYDFMYDGLINLGRDGKYPALAESWEISDDGLQIDFKLRKNVKFHNGDPFTAEDVKFTFEAILKPDSGHAYRKGFESSLDHVEVVDPHTARFVLKQPWPGFFTTTRYGLTPIMPKKYYEEVGAKGFQEKPIGTGPFMLDSLKAGEWTKFVAFNDYWEGAPHVKTAKLVLVKEDFTRYAMVERGEADIVAGLTGPLLEKAKSNEDLQFVSSRYVGTNGIMFNKSTFPASADRRVRLAVAHAINAKEIAEKIQGGICEVASSAFTPATFGYLDGLSHIPYDPEKAKALLKEAGVEPGTKVTFTVQTTSFSAMPNTPQVLEAVAGNLEAVGFTVERKSVDTAAWLAMMRGGKPTDIFYSPSSNPDDGGALMDAYFVTWSGWTAKSVQRPEYDQIVEEQAKTSDPDKRRAVLQRFSKLEAENLESIPFLWCSAPFVYNKKRIADWKPALGSGYHNDIYRLKLN